MIQITVQLQSFVENPPNGTGHSFHSPTRIRANVMDIDVVLTLIAESIGDDKGYGISK